MTAYSRHVGCGCRWQRCVRVCRCVGTRGSGESVVHGSERASCARWPPLSRLRSVLVCHGGSRGPVKYLLRDGCTRRVVVCTMQRICSVLRRATARFVHGAVFDSWYRVDCCVAGRGCNQRDGAGAARRGVTPRQDRGASVRYATYVRAPFWSLVGAAVTKPLFAFDDFVYLGFIIRRIR